MEQFRWTRDRPWEGSLTISAGGIVNNAGGIFIGANGAATVTGTGSKWNTGFIEVGSGGNGALTIQNGGVVNSFNGGGGGFIGAFGGNGIVTVSGAGSQWNLPFLEIGTGNGSLAIQNGGVVNGGGTSIGTFSGSNGSATVSGVGSQLITSSVCVGCAGQGTLTLNSGGAGSSATGLTIGSSAGVTGTMTLTDAGTKWTNTSGTVVVGALGTGTLNVQNGAMFSNLGNLIVGQNGIGTMTITTGGQVSDVNATVGAVFGSTGNVLVDAGTWTNSGSLNIGINGTGVVTVEDNGSLSAGNTTVGSNGSLIVDPAVVDVFGNFTLLPNGVLQLDIGGITPDLFSQLDISGFGLFQGTVDFDFINGFAPTTGESFDLINALGADFSAANFKIDGLEPGFVYTDTFANGSFDLVAQNDGVSTTATPEPSSLWLLASALVILSVAVWRKNSKARACPGKGSSV